MSDNKPTPAVTPAEPTQEPPAGRDPRRADARPAEAAKPAASAKREKPLITHLAPPNNRGSVGQTVIPRGRNISWAGGPVAVFSDGSDEPAAVRLNPMDPSKRGPNVYALSPELVAQLVRTGAARVATLKKTLGADAAKALDEEEQKARLERARAARAAGGPPDGSPERQTKPEERRYGRNVYTVLPPRQLEAPK